jgi:glycosyltransferase involved in cell wall biosynthesis
MNIFFYACNAFEPWDFRNPDTVGIGGSETAQIELAKRLAKRGHNVVSYAPVADDCPKIHDGVKWSHYKNADLTQPGLWIIFRSPGAADKFNLPIEVPNHSHIAFDWGGSLECNEELRQMARNAYAAGKGVHIIAAAGEKEVPPNEQYEKMLKEANVPYTSINVVLFGKSWDEAATRKVEKMKELGCAIIYDDQPAILNAVKEAGFDAILSYSTDKDLKEQRNQTLWMVAQDVVYWDGAGGAYRPERTNKLSKVLALCPVHMDYLKTSFPFMADRVFLSSNGIKTDAIDESFPVDNMPNRDPYRIIWMSSPDRGLEALLHIFNRAKEYEPKLSLHIYYGFDNWNKVIGGEQKKTKKAISTETVAMDEFLDTDLLEFKFGKPSCVQETMKKTIVDLSKQGGVYFHGRTNQPTLWGEIAKSGIWCYSSTFTETSCISCMEVQALGAIPVTNNLWALEANIANGIIIEGDPMSDMLVRLRYAHAIVNLANNPQMQEAIRQKSMPWARKYFDWEKFVDEYEAWIGEIAVSNEDLKEKFKKIR